MLAITDIDINGEKARVTVFADAKTDVSLEAVTALAGREVEIGSTAITADGECAFLKSDGTWNWLGGDE